MLARFRLRRLTSKLTLLMSGCVGLALAVAAAVFVATDLDRVRSHEEQELTTLGATLGAAAVAAGTEDAASAARLLDSLRHRAEVEAACLLDAAGERVAAYGPDRPWPRRPHPGCYDTADGRLEVVVPIIEDQTLRGTLVLRATTDDLRSQTLDYLGVVATVISTLIAAALLVTYRLQRIVSAPILELARTARVISARGDYALRVVPRSDDEIGVLARQFNAMLDRIEQGDRRLREAQRRLECRVEDQTEEITLTRDMTVFALARLADSRDPETGEHLERIRAYTQLLAERLAEAGPYTDVIDDGFLTELYRASPLHDIGKVGIADAVLLKPGRLTPDEFTQMQTHTRIGATALEQAAGYAACGGFLTMAASVARHHHERYDGTGYPDGLAGDAIPLAARIVALADVFDALTSVRVYKDAMPTADARELILAERGRHFDPAVVDAFEACYERFEKLACRCPPKGERFLPAKAPPATTPAAEPEPEPELASV